jgi:hypothetical protein
MSTPRGDRQIAPWNGPTTCGGNDLVHASSHDFFKLRKAQARPASVDITSATTCKTAEMREGHG